jgi:hypothetical protein
MVKAPQLQQLWDDSLWVSALISMELKTVGGSFPSFGEKWQQQVLVT